MLARVRDDRLLRWSAYAAVPALWFAIALVNPLPLLVPILTALAIWFAMQRGLIERHDPPEDPDFF